MSSINGDKARSNRRRRQRLKLREGIRTIRAASSKTAAGHAKKK